MAFNQHDQKQKKECLFCDFITRKNTDVKIIYEDNDLFAIVDKYPASKIHFLIIPRKHIDNVKHLSNKQDYVLVERMNALGEKLMREEFNDQMTDFRSGFTWPPFNTINHLHLHFISPYSQVSLLKRFIYGPNNCWFVTPQYVLKRLSRL